MLKLLLVSLILVPSLVLDSKVNTLLDNFLICQNSVLKGGQVNVKSRLLKTVERKRWQIINGSSADINDFPYSSLLDYCDLEKNLLLECGGSIITENYIMSAAHCAIEWDFFFTALKPEHYLIQVGSSFRNKGDQFLKVSEVHVHPDFQIFGEMSDLSVLKTSERIIMSSKVSPIPLATPDLSHKLEEMENSRKECLITGWGTTDLRGDLHERLRYVRLHLIPFETCVKLVNKKPKVTSFLKREIHLCTENTNKGNCRGDSGGALVCITDGVPTAWGVVSFAENCSQIPTYYARVDNAHSFLEEFLDNNSSHSVGDILKPLFHLVIQAVASVGLRSIH